MSEKIKARRHELGWSREKVAVHAGVSVNTVYAIETGKESVRRSNLLAVLKVLGLELADVAANAGEGE